MKNFKRLAAAALAATMALALSVSAFAEVVATSDDNITYASAAATYGNTITAKDGTQMTVVIINKAKANTTLTGEDLLYINQDQEGVLSLTSMGTKIDLLEVDEDGKAKYAGDYLIRVGYYNESNVWTVAEGEFTVATKANAPTILYGDANQDEAIDIYDATLILKNYLGTDKIVGETALKAADANRDNAVDIYDATLVLKDYLGTDKIVQD